MRESRERQWIYVGTAAVLAVVAVIVVVGLVMTWYLPPRAHVLTVGDRDFTARAVADRAYYLATSGNGNAQIRPADEGVNSLVRQEILLQVGSTLVDEVTEQDVRGAIAQRVGLEGDTDEAYAEALAAYLRVAPIDREALEDLVRAGVIEDRLTEQFREDVPEAGDQMHLLAVQPQQRADAQALVDAVRGGQDFREAAVELGLAASEEEVTEVGWYAPETLAESVRPSLESLQAGEVSDPVESQQNLGYAVYFVAERTVDQPYEDSVRDRLAQQALADFITDQEEAFDVQVDLSNDERRWITQQVQDDLQDS